MSETKREQNEEVLNKAFSASAKAAFAAQREKMKAKGGKNADEENAADDEEKDKKAGEKEADE